MRCLKYLPAPPQSARAVFWLQAASLLVTGWAVWKIAFVPFGASFFLSGGVFFALLYSCFALGLSAAITLGLLLAMRSIARQEVWLVTLRTSAAGLWFAPAMILLGASSSLANMAALALVVSVTRVLYAQWRAPDPASAQSPAPSSAARQRSARWPAFTSAAALQAGFVLARLRDPTLSSAFYALAAGILTAYSIEAGVWTRDREPTLPRSVMALAVTFLIALIVTVAGIGMYGGGGGEGDTASGAPATSASHRPPPPPPPLPDPGRKFQPPPIDPARLGPAVSVPGGVPGVILWPETEPVPLLVEPLPKGGLANRAPSRPFVIPFSGSYWMFRAGFTRPPANSLVQRGTPTSSWFKTVDMWPLEMEAHQRLDREIDLSCCAAIRVDVLNADKFPGTVTLELALIHHAGTPMRLGRAPIRSTPDLSGDPVVPVQETLEFRIPAIAPVFDEFDVMFHRERSRADRSARIAIQRFVLVPR